MDRAGDPDVIVDMGTASHGTRHLGGLAAMVATDVLANCIGGPDLTGCKW
jgi:hypothetical protein